MNHMVSRFAVLTFVAALWVSTSSGMDCVTLQPEKAFAVASRVITGKVSKIEKVSRTSYIIHFDVLRSWKSTTSTKLQVLGSDNFVFGDPYVFAAGVTYVIYTQHPIGLQSGRLGRLDRMGECAIRIVKGKQEILSEEKTLERIASR